MADDNQQPVGQPLQEPRYEPIGAGRGLSPGEGLAGNDDGSGFPAPVQSGGGAGVLALNDCLGALKSVRFWLGAAAVVGGAWVVAAAGALLFRPLGEEANGPPAGLIYALAAMVMPAAAAFLAVSWGMRGQARLLGAEDPAPERATWPVLLAVALKGLVLSGVVLMVLLLHAGVAGLGGASAAVAAVAAVAVVLECITFGAIGAGTVAWLGGIDPRRTGRARAVGWGLAAVLVVGAPAAAAALLPLVRAQEPVTVALNVERASDGTHVAYRCSDIPAGVIEVVHTERLMWLPAFSPSVVFAMLARDADRSGAVLGWLPAVLQEAADGTRVPCVRGDPRSKEEPQVPLALIGIIGQGAVAGACIAGGNRASLRRGP